MALSPGTRLGPYAVSAKIGEGGMGQVWQATDTTLNRQVALKILPDAFAADPDRLARFQREAQVLASLNHPNIAAIHGIEQSDDTQALVLDWSKGRLWRIGSPRGRSQLMRPSPSRSRSRKRSKPRTRLVSSIAASSPRISRCARTAR